MQLRSRFIPLLFVMAALAACSGSDSEASAAEVPASATEVDEPSSSTSTSSDEGATETVTIEHRYGTTVLDEVPQRIVTLNVQWTDVVLAMDLVPTAYTLSTAIGETDIYPWQVGLLDDAEQIAAGDAGIPFEAIAAAQPDLILGAYNIQDQAAYDTLAAIAPTIGPLGDLQVDPWSDQITVLGQALRAEDAAAEAIAEVDALAAAVAEELPGLEGATYTFANFVPGTGIYVIADPDDGASRLFDAMGMEIDPDIVALDEEAVGRALISFEEIALLDADLVGVLLNGTDPSDVIGLAELPSSENGTLIDFAYADIVGLNTPTPLSVPYLLDLMRPTLELVAAR